VADWSSTCQPCAVPDDDLFAAVGVQVGQRARIQSAAEAAPGSREGLPSAAAWSRQRHGCRAARNFGAGLGRVDTREDRSVERRGRAA
jgi:hypothetical protein